MKNSKSQKNNPYGWFSIKVGEIFDFLGTYAISRENLVNGILNENSIGNIHYGDIHARYKASNIDICKIAIPRVKDKEFFPSKNDFLIDGDLVMADVSEDYEGIGETISVHGVNKKKVVGGLHTFVLRDNSGKTDERFRQYIFRNPEIRNSLKRIANGVSVYGISKSNLSKFVINLPQLSEQKRIVAVLETWDRAIEKLTKKIEIKKNIKKGLMQQLLSGKKRLRGFSEKWQLFKLGEIGEVRTSSVDKLITEGEKKVFLLNYMDVYRRDHIQQSDSFQEVTAKDQQIVSSNLKKGDVLFTPSSETPDDIGHSAVVVEDLKGVIFSYHLMRFRPNNNVLHYSFSAYCFKTYDFYLELWKKSQGATRFTLSKNAIEESKIKIPQSKEEQIAVANVLDSANIEIKKLENKLNKLKDQKKYLLNNLITGQIRTPENLSVE